MTIAFPEMRSRLRRAVDTLCDPEVQERLWIAGESIHPFETGFDDTLLFLVDELEMFEPAELVGTVLETDAELTAFNALTDAVRHLIEVIGKLGSFKDAQGSGVVWTSCVAAARELHVQMGPSQ